MQIESDRVVTFHYRLSDESGNPLEDSFAGDPLLILHGHGGIIPGLEREMEGRQAGDAFEVTLQPTEGYGLRNEELKQRIPIKYITGAKKTRLRPGQVVSLESRDGPRQVTILKVGKFNVDVDGNHPLAGKVLSFQVEIMEVREATADELAHGHAHGAGGHHH